MKVCFYNPDEEKFPILRVLEKVCSDLKFGFVTDIQYKDWINECDIAVIHGRVADTLVGAELKPVGYNELLEKSLISKCNMVVIFISGVSMSQSKQPERILFSDSSANSIRYLFPVRHTKESGLVAQTEAEENAAIEKWTQLLKLVANNKIIEKWFEDNDSNNLLSELFLEQESFYLIALVILCQGFLATHIDPKSKISNSEVIKQALSDMGLEKGFIDSQIINQLQDEVSKPDWWRRVFSEEKNLVIQKLRTEWKDEKFSVNVSQLVDTIYSDYSDKDFINLISPELIAKSYLDIAKKLRKK